MASTLKKANSTPLLRISKSTMKSRLSERSRVGRHWLPPLPTATPDMAAVRRWIALKVTPAKAELLAGCRAASTQLRHYLARQQLQVRQIGQVEHLGVQALHAQGSPRAELVDDLGGRADQRAVGAQLVYIPPDHRGAAGYFGVIAAGAEHKRARVDDRVGRPAGRGDRVGHPPALGS